MFRHLPRVILTIPLVLLVACGGGGGGGSTSPAPPTPVYRITASVTGISGSGLILQNNGATDVAVSGNGTVVITSTAVSGSAYAVTVKTQPSSPSQTCTVTGGTGTMSGSDVSTVAVSCTTNSYGITATVSGLAGTGLTLQNNAVNDLTPSSNGTLTIVSATASGSAYAVTVKTQPSSPSQTCTVTNGSGTVANGAVSNVAVTCATNTYPITATVSGLSGSGLILQNNGANDLSFSGNGTFSISSAAVSGSAYAVTVKAQPSSPSQTCTVTNGSGTVTNAPVSNVLVSCAWGAPTVAISASDTSLLANNLVNVRMF